MYQKQGKKYKREKITIKIGQNIEGVEQEDKVLSLYPEEMLALGITHKQINDLKKGKLVINNEGEFVSQYNFEAKNNDYIIKGSLVDANNVPLDIKKIENITLECVNNNLCFLFWCDGRYFAADNLKLETESTHFGIDTVELVKYGDRYISKRDTTATIETTKTNIIVDLMFPEASAGGLGIYTDSFIRFNFNLSDKENREFASNMSLLTRPNEKMFLDAV